MTSSQDSHVDRPVNRLSEETSPYLLQHLHNPVDWFPWGPEALEQARELDRPIFLSVGYSACHWCHVMERESFENEKIAGLLNQSFVAIKVDREERPDIDQVYMNAVQLLTRRGGWPMSSRRQPKPHRTIIWNESSAATRCDPGSFIARAAPSRRGGTHVGVVHSRLAKDPVAS